ncbi:hypothetical protein QUF50_10370 [Thiotrichales bacterium HSG1]|nr:hypothetical protein [Thiotrichales bacterium HSG1]
MKVQSEKWQNDLKYQYVFTYFIEKINQTGSLEAKPYNGRCKPAIDENGQNFIKRNNFRATRFNTNRTYALTSSSYYETI